MIKNIINKIKTMAKIQLQPIDANDKAAAIDALMAYKKQNPAKFEAKKVALYAKYGLSEDTEIETKDSSDIELEKAKAKVTKKTNE